MKLIDIVSQLDNFDEEMTIYASEPWDLNSDALVDFEPDEGGLPLEAREKNLEYFLEVYLAKEFLDGWVENQKAGVSRSEICNRLIEYAINDA